MPTPDQLPPELRHADDTSSGPDHGSRRSSDRAATRFFASSSLHRVVAWVVIAAMVLVPLGASLVDLLGG